MTLRERLMGWWSYLRRPLDVDRRFWFWLLNIVFFFGLGFLLAAPYLSGRFNLVIGQPAPRTVVAPRTVLNLPAMRQREQAAMAAVQPVYETDGHAASNAAAELDGIFRAVSHLARTLPPGASTTTVRAAWRSTVGLDVPLAVIRTMLDAPPLHLLDLERGARSILDTVMAGAFRSGDLPEVHQTVERDVLKLPVSDPERIFLAAAVTRCVRPTLVYSPSRTAALRRKAAASVAPIYLSAGDVVVTRGQRVTGDQLVLLRELGLLRSQRLLDLGGAFLLAGAIVLSIYFYLRILSSRLLERESTWVIVVAIFLVTVLGARALVPVSAYLIPLAAAGMLLAILIEGRAAAFISFLLDISIVEATGLDFGVGVTLILGTLAGIYMVHRFGHPVERQNPRPAWYPVRLGERSQLILAGLAVSIVSAAVAAATLLLGTPLPGSTALLSDLGWAAAGGIISAIVTTGSLPFFEAAFGIVTPVKILELANPGQPLLHRLMIEAPGTYYHSMVVANLAEAAAQAIHADGLLARVGAYYHDIGKIKRPYFFIDNQFGNDNPHDKLSPTLSSLIITMHVKDGLELGREARLPPEILRFIAEHHGTTLVRYFYNRAGGEEQGVNEDDFRYEGPKPQSRETAIVMLADSVEAAVRSLGRPTPGKVEGMVRRLIKERLYEGQLEESDLTFRDLDKIARAFVRVLSGFFHNRIEYPEKFLREIERGERRGGDGKSTKEHPAAGTDSGSGGGR